LTNTPRDVFLHLLAIITLVTSAVSFGFLSFACINIYVPDVVSDQYYTRSGYLSTMRLALATLIIIFPVFLWVSWFIRKDIVKFPVKSELKIRKWLLYLTLFIAALVIIGDLVALLRSFLEGELSQRFVLKIITVLFVAGSIFIHYFSELKGRKITKIRIFDWTVIGIIIAVTTMGFFIAGTPQNQRLIRLDERRVNDLQQIQWQIINYWQRKEMLPSKLIDLSDPISGFIVPQDPETVELYGYRVLTDLKFELCAVFNTASENLSESKLMPAVPDRPSEIRPTSNEVWWHNEGKVCFERIIDPDFYPPIKGKLGI